MLTTVMLCKFENANSDVHVVNGNVHNTFIFNNVEKDAAKLEAPAKRGAKSLELLHGRRRIASYSPTELAQFKSIHPADRPIESEIDAILEVISPVLKGDGVWRFRYGRMTLTAKLLDDDYRSKVLSGEESFRHGDRLKAKLKTIQENLGDKISTKHYITKMIDRI